MKKMAAFLCAVIMITVLLNGCSESKQEDASDTTQSASLNFAVGNDGSDYYNYGNSIATVFSKASTGITLKVIKTDDMKNNLNAIASSTADIAIVRNDILYNAYNGTGDFKKNKLQNFSILANVYSEVCETIVDSTQDISTIGALKGKKVSVGKEGSASYNFAQQTLGVYGMTFNDILVSNLDLNDSLKAMENKQIDAFFYVGDAKNSTIDTFSKTNRISVLSFENDKAAKFMQQYPFYAQYTIPKNLYNTQLREGTTFALRVVIVAKNDMSEDSAYKFVKALFDNRSLVSDENIKGSELNKTSALKGVVAPVNPGAKKYFDEIKNGK